MRYKDLKEASVFKQTANLIMHIYLSRPIDGSIFNSFNSSKSNQTFKVLSKEDPNIVIAITYGFYKLSKFHPCPLRLSCHALVELVQTIGLKNISKETSEIYKQLVKTTAMLSLILEQMVYKTNSEDKEYPHCEELLSVNNS